MCNPHFPLELLLAFSIVFAIGVLTSSVWRYKTALRSSTTGA